MPGPRRNTDKNIRADYAARAVVASSKDDESKESMRNRAIDVQDAVLSGAPRPHERRKETEMEKLQRFRMNQSAAGWNNRGLEFEPGEDPQLTKQRAVARALWEKSRGR